jgi:hypothetical protein
MADEQDNQDIKAPAGKAEKTVKLAQGKNAPTFAEPGQKDAEINVGMDHTIYVPSLDVQKAGFTPYRIVDGKHVDATAELLTQFPGIYKPFADK